MDEILKATVRKIKIVSDWNGLKIENLTIYNGHFIEVKLNEYERVVIDFDAEIVINMSGTEGNLTFTFTPEEHHSADFVINNTALMAVALARTHGSHSRKAFRKIDKIFNDWNFKE